MTQTVTDTVTTSTELKEIGSRMTQIDGQTPIEMELLMKTMLSSMMQLNHQTEMEICGEMTRSVTGLMNSQMTQLNGRIQTAMVLGITRMHSHSTLLRLQIEMVMVTAITH